LIEERGHIEPQADMELNLVMADLMEIVQLGVYVALMAGRAPESRRRPVRIFT
jgi:hypothetical protein